MLLLCPKNCFLSETPIAGTYIIRSGPNFAQETKTVPSNSHKSPVSNIPFQLSLNWKVLLIFGHSSMCCVYSHRLTNVGSLMCMDLTFTTFFSTILFCTVATILHLTFFSVFEFLIFCVRSPTGSYLLHKIFVIKDGHKCFYRIECLANPVKAFFDKCYQWARQTTLR